MTNITRNYVLPMHKQKITNRFLNIAQEVTNCMYIQEIIFLLTNINKTPYYFELKLEIVHIYQQLLV